MNTETPLPTPRAGRPVGSTVRKPIKGALRAVKAYRRGLKSGNYRGTVELARHLGIDYRMLCKHLEKWVPEHKGVWSQMLRQAWEKARTTHDSAHHFPTDCQ